MAEGCCQQTLARTGSLSSLGTNRGKGRRDRWLFQFSLGSELAGLGQFSPHVGQRQPGVPLHGALPVMWAGEGLQQAGRCQAPRTPCSPRSAAPGHPLHGPQSRFLGALTTQSNILPVAHLSQVRRPRQRTLPTLWATGSAGTGVRSSWAESKAVPHPSPSSLPWPGLRDSPQAWCPGTACFPKAELHGEKFPF